MARRRSWLLALAGSLGAFFVSESARAIDPFEIQVYDGTANAPLVPGLELHLNRVMSGVTTSQGSELPPNHQSHATFEPSLGLTPWWEIGGYFQLAMRPDGEVDYAGVKLRSKFVTPPRKDSPWRFGLNLELSILPSTYDAGRIGNEVRPILAFENERFLFVVNPIVDVSYEGSGFRDGPTFEPAAMAKVKAFGFAFGLETYSSVGPIAHPRTIRAQEHYVFEALDVLSIPHFEWNMGIGEGLTDASNSFVVKMILGYSWEHEPEPQVSMRTMRGAR